MSSKIQIRRDTAANWTATNPVLAQGEPGLETDTRKIKYGTGSTAWNLLDYASGGSTGGGDFTTGFTDGVNDNTWHFVTVTGKKEFDFHTQGYKLINITLTAPMLVDIGSGNLTFNTTDTPEIAELWLNYNSYGNQVDFYTKGDWDQGNLSSFFTGMTSPTVGTYVTTAPVPFVEGDKIVIKYWAEGTTWTGGNYDNWDTISMNSTSTGTTNTTTFDTNEYPWMNWTGFANPTYFPKSSISFDDHGSSRDRRNVTDVSIDQVTGIATVTFDGNPIQTYTPTETTFTYTANSLQSDVYNPYIESGAYDNFKNECRYGWQNSNTNKYTGGTQRSGWIIINGGSPIDISWYNNFDAQQRAQINTSSPVTININDTVEVHFYKEVITVSFQMYIPNAGNWNNGYKWFDWKDDIATEYSPALTNAIQGGRGQWSMKVYVPEDNGSATMSGNLEWIGVGDGSTYPRDFLRNTNVNTINSSYFTYPMSRFDTSGVVFLSNNTANGSFSRTMKVRMIYKWELIIAEDDYYWYC